MARGRTEVANLATARAGAGTVTDLDGDGTLEARVLRADWDALLDAALAEHPWDFAQAWAEAARLAEAPPWARAAFAFPADCVLLREVRVGAKGQRDKGTKGTDLSAHLPLCPFAPVPYRVAFLGPAKAVHVNVGEGVSVWLAYTRRETDPARWSRTFTDYLGWKLAAHLCLCVRGLAEGLNACVAMQEKALADARRQDAVEEGGVAPQGVSMFETCRW